MISLLVAGDFVPSARTVGLVCNREEKLLFGEFISVFRQTDYNIVNLECPVVLNDKTGGIEKSGPHLKAGRKAVEILKKAVSNWLHWLTIIFMIMEIRVWQTHLRHVVHWEWILLAEA